MTPLPENENPYPGPRPFEQHEQKLFFGRERPVRDLFSLTVAHRVLLIYAQSGAGKTSLLNAGLIPLLKEKQFRVLPVARVRGTIPRDVNLENIPNVFVFNALMSWTESHADPKSLAAGTIADFLKAEAAQAPEAERLTPRVAIFDQFEELFEVYSERWAEREGFFRQVADALDADPLLRVIFVIREDYLARLDPYADLLPERLRTRFRLERLGAEEAQLAIVLPLQGTKRSFGEGVAAQLVKELLEIHVESAAGEKVKATGEFVEPVQLQVVCQNLWRDLPPDTTEITLAHLQKFGDVNEALGDFYARGVSAAVRDAAVKEPVVRAWFEQHLITAAGTRGTVYRGREQTGGLVNNAVDVLENQHLIRPELRAGSRWYELTHDRFIEPIQNSNRAWRERIRAAKNRRRAILVRGVFVVLLLALVCASAIALYSWNQTQIADQTRDLTSKAWAAYNNNDLENALAIFNQVIALNSQSAAAYDGRGYVYMKRGDLDQALVDYNKAIDLDPKYVDAYNNRGSAYYDQKQYDQAIADYSKAIELDPKYAYAYHNRGLAYSNKGDLDQAIANYTQAISVDPNYAHAYNNRGSAYYRKGNLDQAIADYTKAIELDPQYADAFNGRGNAYLDQKQYDQAIADYSKAIELDPKYAIAYRNRGLAYYNKGNLDQALVDYDKAIDLDPKYVGAYNDRGNAYYDQKQYDQAIADYNKAIEIDPKYADSYISRGNAYSGQKQYDQAIADYSKAIELDPKFAIAYRNRGLAYYNKDNLDQAIADYNKAIEIDPKYADAYISRGNAYSDQKQYDQAIADYNQAIALDPKDAVAYYDRGLAYSDQEQYDQAIADYNKAVEIDPKYADAYISRGLAYSDQKQYDQAIADYNQAIALDPKDAVAYYNRGRAYYAQKQYDLAIADYNQVIALDPKYVNAYWGRGLAYREKGLDTQAIADFEMYLQLVPNAENRAQFEQWIRELKGQ